jgi:hypothetical protein
MEFQNLNDNKNLFYLHNWEKVILMLNEVKLLLNLKMNKIIYSKILIFYNFLYHQCLMNS